MDTDPERIVKAVVILMQRESEHNRKISKMEEASGCELHELKVYLFEAAVEMLGIPDYGTLQKLIQKHKDEGKPFLKPIVWQDDFIGRWNDAVESGSQSEMEAFPRWVLALLDGSIN